MNNDRLQRIIKKRFKKILLKEKIDCVLGDYLITGAAVREVCEELNIPIVANVLGYEIHKEDILKNYADEYSNLAKYNAFVIPVAKNMISKLENLGFTSKQIQYSPIGAKDDFFKIKPSYTSYQFLAIGRFTETKSPQISIKAFSKVLKKFPQARFVFAGTGELFDNCKQLIDDLHINDKIDLVGWVNQEEQIKLLSESAIFIQHSVTAGNGDAEGTPVAIIEASAAGLPIVSTRHGGIPDTVVDGVTGFLVEEQDLDAMAEKMIYLLENINLIQEFGQRGKDFIQKNFSLEKHLNDVKDTIIKSVNP